MLILGSKNSEREEEHWSYKSRLAFQRDRAHAADGARVCGDPGDLYGKPADLGLARAVNAAAMLKDWRVEASDIEGAYLTAALRGPPAHEAFARPVERSRSAGGCPGELQGSLR